MSVETWHRAALALKLLALDPVRLGGAIIRMRAGPLRDAVVQSYVAPVPVRRLPVTISDEHLLGGMDLAASLSAGKMVRHAGIFSAPCTAILPMAERCSTGLSARLSRLLDEGAVMGILALDEGAEPDEAAPDGLADRLAFHIAPEGRMPPDWRDAHSPEPGAPVKTDDAIEQLTALAARFGIDSLRAPLLALHTAEAHARLENRAHLSTCDIEMAAALVYPHRATQIPAPEADETPPPQPPDPAPQNDSGTRDDGTIDALPDTDMLIAAVTALLPDGLLAGLVDSRRARAASGSGAGRKMRSNRRGRPMPSRAGRLSSDARVDPVATLRAAVPWQAIRRQNDPSRSELILHKSDIRLRRFAQHSDRLLIFAVDASGSAAMARLGEAKGAVELLLADAYASRDHVALIAFKGETAQLLLSPTRSLVQAKRQLSALPGGGGTPLASGLEAAMRLANQAEGNGMSPSIILMTDGRANIARDGTPGRAAAAKDATDVARAIRMQGTGTMVIDTANRPQAGLRDLSSVLAGTYLPMPRADAHRVSAAVGTALRT